MKFKILAVIVVVSAHSFLWRACLSTTVQAQAPGGATISRPCRHGLLFCVESETPIQETQETHGIRASVQVVRHQPVPGDPSSFTCFAVYRWFTGTGGAQPLGPVPCGGV